MYKACVRSWKVKMHRAREERDFANVDDLLMSGSDSEQENMDEIGGPSDTFSFVPYVL
jgi:hypothetical protein